MRALMLVTLLVCASPTTARTAATEQAALRHQLRVDPDDRMIMANLARVYAREGRTERSQRLYRALLGMEDVQLDAEEGGPVWSHALARHAMERIASPPELRISSRVD